MIRWNRCTMGRNCALLAALGSLLAFSQTGAPRGRAQTPAPVPTEAVRPEDRCTLQGLVLNNSTGEPIRKATLRLNRVIDRPRGGGSVFPSSVSVMTDAVGQYTISGIEPGRYRLSAERAGFVTQFYGSRPGTTQGGGSVLTLEKGQRLTDLSFRLVPQGVITGKVVDEDGDPLQGVSVQCLRQVYVRGRKQWVPVNGQSTNDLGEYRLHSLPAGRYYVSAMQRTSAADFSNETGVEEAYAATYYPGAVSADMATAVQVTPGSELRGIDIRLQKTQTVRLRGRVINGVTGRPVQTAGVRVVSRGTEVLDVRPRGGRPIDRNGGFMVTGLTPGSYWLIADSVQERVPMHARLALDVGTAPIDGVTLTLAPGQELNGVVRFENSSETGVSGVRVHLEPKQMGLGGGAPSVNVAADGTFKLRPVTPDAYFVRISGLPETHYLKSLKLGDDDVTDSGIDLSAGVNASLTVTLASGAGLIAGSVQDEKQQPAASAIVVLIPEGPRRDDTYHYRSAIADQNGQFGFGGLAPGEYNLYAFDLVDPGAYMDPEFMRNFERRAERITIRPNSQESAQLKLILTATR